MGETGSSTMTCLELLIKKGTFYILIYFYLAHCYSIKFVLHFALELWENLTLFFWIQGNALTTRITVVTTWVTIKFCIPQNCLSMIVALRRVYHHKTSVSSKCKLLETIYTQKTATHHMKKQNSTYLTQT